MNIALVRGAFLNNFETQNYLFRNKSLSLTAFSSLRSIHSSFPFPVTRLLSLSDTGIPLWLANRTFGDSQILFGLEKSVRNFDIVHTADSHYYYTYQLAKLREKKSIKRLISTSWETIPFNNESVERKKKLKQFSMKYIDHYLCYGERAKKSLIAEGVNVKKITVINLGVDLKKFSPEKRTSPYKNVKVLFTGRDVPEKGLQDLNVSIGQLSGINKAELITAHGVSYEQMPALYRRADIFVMPSKTTKTWEEQYGMSLIEAMASGLPVIAYRCGSIPELLGDAGILVPEGDTDELSEQLRRLSKDANLRQKLGTMARRRAQLYFDSEKTIRSLQKFYETQCRHTNP